MASEHVKKWRELMRGYYRQVNSLYSPDAKLPERERNGMVRELLAEYKKVRGEGWCIRLWVCRFFSATP